MANRQKTIQDLGNISRVGQWIVLVPKYGVDLR